MLTWICYHLRKICITGCTKSCHFDKMLCKQWWKCSTKLWHFHFSITVNLTINACIYWIGFTYISNDEILQSKVTWLSSETPEVSYIIRILPKLQSENQDLYFSFRITYFFQDSILPFYHNYMIFMVQGWFEVCTQPMRDVITKKYHLSLGGWKPRISPVAALPPLMWE